MLGASLGMFRPARRAGDWACSNCLGHNYSKRMDCFKCGMPRLGSLGCSNVPTSSGLLFPTLSTPSTPSAKSISMSAQSPVTPSTPFQGVGCEARSPVEEMEHHHQFMLKLEARGLELAQEKRRIELELQVVDAQLGKEQVIHRELMTKILDSDHLQSEGKFLQRQVPDQASVGKFAAAAVSPLPAMSPNAPPPPTPILTVPFHDLSRGEQLREQREQQRRERTPIRLKSRRHMSERARSASIQRRPQQQCHREGESRREGRRHRSRSRRRHSGK